MTQPFLGQISMFAGNFAPRGWALCQGQLLSISQYSALFSLLGTTYGGNGTSNFALPDLRSRIPVGQGQGPGLSNRVLGEMSGTENVTLLTTNMPGHSHPFNASTTKAAQAGVTTTVLPGDTTDQGGTFYVTVGSDLLPEDLPNNVVGASGNNQPHTNIMPSLVITYIIALQGIFPSRN